MASIIVWFLALAIAAPSAGSRDESLACHALTLCQIELLWQLRVVDDSLLWLWKLREEIYVIAKLPSFCCRVRQHRMVSTMAPGLESTKPLKLTLALLLTILQDLLLQSKLGLDSRLLCQQIQICDTIPSILRFGS